MAIVGRTATVVENASATSVTGTRPTDRVAGDIVVVTFLMTCTTAQFTGPGGSWTPLFTPFTMNDNCTLAAYWQKNPGADPTATSSGAAGRVSAITEAYGGVHGTTPLDVTPATAATAPYGTSLAVSSITTVTNGCMLISAGGVDSSTALLTKPASMTLIGNASGGSVGRGLALAQESQTTAGATGTRTWTQNSTSFGMAAYLAALRPGNTLTATGSSTATGVLAKTPLKAFTGSSTAVGVYSALRVVTKLFTASSTAAGVLIKRANKAFSGAVTAAGVIRKTLARIFTGSSTAVGVFRKAFVRLCTGSITASGNLIKTALGRLFGRPGRTTVTVRKAGDVTMRIRRS